MAHQPSSGLKCFYGDDGGAKITVYPRGRPDPTSHHLYFEADAVIDNGAAVAKEDLSSRRNHRYSLPHPPRYIKNRSLEVTTAPLSMRASSTAAAPPAPSASK